MSEQQQSGDKIHYVLDAINHIAFLVSLHGWRFWVMHPAKYEDYRKANMR